MEPPAQHLPLAATLQNDAVACQASSPLFRLPREIRDTIWRYATETYCDPDKPFRLALRRSDMTGPRRCDTALLETCRAVYAEAWDLPLRQTALVIHEGYQDDREEEWPKMSWPKKRGMALFCLQAWQLLLIQKVQMSFYQSRLEGGGIGEWLDKIAEARELALGIVRKLDEEAEESRGEIARGILKLKVSELVVRVNRRDWITWAEEPRRPEGSPERESIFNIFTPGLGPKASRELSLRLQIPAGWTPHTGLFSRDFIFTLALETFGAKADQLDKVANEARAWRFPTPLYDDDSSSRHSSSGSDDGSDEASTTEMMVWDGEVVASCFTRSFPETQGWLARKTWRQFSKKIETRRIRYVRTRGCELEHRLRGLSLVAADGVVGGGGEDCKSEGSLC